jgi:hypothetical protein
MDEIGAAPVLFPQGEKLMGEGGVRCYISGLLTAPGAPRTRVKC